MLLHRTKTLRQRRTSNFAQSRETSAHFTTLTLLLITFSLSVTVIADLNKIASASAPSDKENDHNHHTLSQEQEHRHSSASFDEEIFADSRQQNDHIKHEDSKAPESQELKWPSWQQTSTHGLDHASQSDDLTARFEQPANRLTAETSLALNDPFAATFDDFLKEATQNPAKYYTSADANLVNAGGKHSDESLPVTAIPYFASSIIEEDENAIKPAKESRTVDYVFPFANSLSRQESGTPAKNLDSSVESAHESRSNGDINHHRNDISSNSLPNEIKLLFAWKQRLTNKCSKTCGKGFRLFHISCVDLKYDVRVEDRLCQESNVPRPGETSGESCNEIDCAPQWITTEFQECNPISSEDGICRPNRYKRAQCMQINHRGVPIYLDDSKCNSSIVSAGDLISQENNSVSHNNKMVESTAPNDDESIELDMNTQPNDRNEIMHAGSYFVDSFLDDISGERQSHPINEPFFHPEPWSECSGAICGSLGRRSRKLSCRLYLSRSSKFIDLPESSCHSAPLPDTHEPCYMDCSPEDTSMPQKNTTSSATAAVNFDDELVYDLEMTRHVWHHVDWTKCSAECLGGQRESLIECWDKVANITVDPSLCDREIKPKPILERCNNTPCKPEWRVEAFSDCSKPCGSAGIRTRPVICSQRVPADDGFRMNIVADELCLDVNGPMPNKSEHCNRFDCRPEWKVSPWSNCIGKCGYGIRNRTVICVQEFASRDGPKYNENHRHPREATDVELLEAIEISAKDWYPGKSTQIPFKICYMEYKTIPPVEESCFDQCDSKPFIDADINQNYHMSKEAIKRKTITLKVGGKAQILERKNLKIRCRLVNRQGRDNLVKKVSEQVEWRKDGIEIFPNGSLTTDLQLTLDDNHIRGHNVFSDDRNQFMADEPSPERATRLDRSRPRNLIARWKDYRDHQANFEFVPTVKGRFSLVKESTLRIKQLKPGDSGVYTCSYGPFNQESTYLRVLSRRDFLLDDDDELSTYTQYR